MALPRACRGRFTSKRITRQLKTFERQQDEIGKWWLSPAAAIAKCKIRKTAVLSSWADPEGDGCPFLPGEKLTRKPFRDGRGRRIGFYSEDQLEKMLQAAAALPHQLKAAGYIHYEAAAEKYHVSIATIFNLINDGFLKSRGAYIRAKNGLYYWRTYVLEESVKEYAVTRRATPLSPDRITSRQAAQLLGLAKGSAAKRIKKKGLVRHPAVVTHNGNVHDGFHLDRKAVEEELANLASQYALPHQFAGFTWLAQGKFCSLCNIDPNNLMATYGRSSCFYLDGRARPKSRTAHKRRPVLALLIPNRGRGQKRIWVYNQADADLILARQRGTMSADEVRRQAAEILETCQAALKGTGLVCNFSGLAVELSTVPQDVSAAEPMPGAAKNTAVEKPSSNEGHALPTSEYGSVATSRLMEQAKKDHRELLNEHADRVSQLTAEKLRVLMRQTAIIPEFRTRPLSLREAAKLMGFTRTRGTKKAVETLSNLIKDGTIPCEELNRQTYIFSKKDFPAEVWPNLSPEN